MFIFLFTLLTRFKKQRKNALHCRKIYECPGGWDNPMLPFSFFSFFLCPPLFSIFFFFFLLFFFLSVGRKPKHFTYSLMRKRLDEVYPKAVYLGFFIHAASSPLSQMQEPSSILFPACSLLLFVTEVRSQAMSSCKSCFYIFLTCIVLWSCSAILKEDAGPGLPVFFDQTS